MSRTDKTDPYWVKELRYGSEHHDHSRGECSISSDRHHRDRQGYDRCYISLIENYSTGRGYSGSWYSNFPSPPAVKYCANRCERSNRRAARNALKRGNYDAAALNYRPRGGAKWMML